MRDQTLPKTTRRILLRRRPVGETTDADFELVTVDLPELESGQLLLKNIYISLDPAIRGWMNAAKSYMKPIILGEVVRSATIGEVLASRHPEFEVGDRLAGLHGWEDYSVVGPKVIGRKIPHDLPLPLSTSLGVLGGNGLTAYFGLFEVGQPKAGETVLVSAAAGGVGSIVGQLAKRKGCRAVGIAGSDEKCRWLEDELGWDATINYRKQTLLPAIRAACPDGVDVFFDNVGGPVLNAALGCISVGARIVLCGAISQINATELPPGPSNYIRLLSKRASMRGFVTLDYADRWAAASAQLAGWITDGSLKHREHIVEGLENTPQAFRSLFSGGNRGKLMVKVAEPS